MSTSNYRLNELLYLFSLLKYEPESSWNSYKLTWQIMHKFYEIGSLRIQLNDVDIQNILMNISKCSNHLLSFIQIYKARFFVDSWDEDERLTCVIRSGLQFLNDNFIDTQIGVSMLDDQIRKFIHEANFNELNECFEKWKKLNVHFPKRPETIPPTHTWWC
jgi:hypothetical protein